MTYDGHTLRLFKDGVEVGKTNLTGTVSTANQVIRIGDNPSGAQNFDGSIDDVRVYNRALSPSEIQQLIDLADLTTTPIEQDTRPETLVVLEAEFMDVNVTLACPVKLDPV